MSALGVLHGGIDATGVTGLGTAVARLHPTSPRSRKGRWGIATATISQRTHWIAWRTATPYAPTPAGIVPASRSWGMHHAIVYVTPDTSAVIRPSRPRPHSRFVMLSASRMTSIGAAIRRLAIRAAIVRSSGIN